MEPSPNVYVETNGSSRLVTHLCFHSWADFPSRRLMVVLGSGGHTSELLALLSCLPAHLVDNCCYAVADTDTTSMKRIPHPIVPLVERIPRSREVGQSWLSTVFSTARWDFVDVTVVPYNNDGVWAHSPDCKCVLLQVADSILRGGLAP